jgi:predicted metal-binding membrane protein
MVLGIVGLVMMCGYGLGIIPAIIALALAPGAKREIESSRGMVTGDGFVKAGVICSWITVGLVVAGIVLIVLLLVLGAATSSSFESTNTDIGNATGLGLALAALPQWRRLRALPKES